MKKDFKYLYGPVSSWRLGRSLGIDLISQEDKICGFDCIYCQAGRAVPKVCRRKEYVPTKKIIQEIKNLPDIKIDHITFSGRGEPTLAKNLGVLIRQIKKIRKEPITVITNASLINRLQVRKELALADFVIAKLDACKEEDLKKINDPFISIRFNNIVRGLRQFRKQFKGRLGLQIMFVKENKDDAFKIAKIAQGIKPDEVQVNTPLRKSKCKPLSREEIEKITKVFNEFYVVDVYRGRRIQANPAGTVLRRKKER